MHFSTIFAVLSLAAFSSSTPIPDNTQQRPPPSNSGKTPSCPNYCSGTANNQSLINNYVCGDSRLGPKRLPNVITLSTIYKYDRFAGLCPGEFLAKFYNNATSSWIYPVIEGYQLNTVGAPIQGNITFPVGALLDRFGSEYGRYVSPAGTPYMQRALPPSNLDTPPGNGSYPYNYHVYRVVKPFDALSGPIAPWFGQPGQGVQYSLSTNILGLLSSGFLEAVNLKTLYRYNI